MRATKVPLRKTTLQISRARLSWQSIIDFMRKKTVIRSFLGGLKEVLCILDRIIAYFSVNAAEEIKPHYS